MRRTCGRFIRILPARCGRGRRRLDVVADRNSGPTRRRLDVAGWPCLPTIRDPFTRPAARYAGTSARRRLADSRSTLPFCIRAGSNPGDRLGKQLAPFGASELFRGCAGVGLARAVPHHGALPRRDRSPDRFSCHKAARRPGARASWTPGRTGLWPVPFRTRARQVSRDARAWGAHSAQSASARPVIRRSGTDAVPIAGLSLRRACSSEHSVVVHSVTLRVTGDDLGCGRMAPGSCASSRALGDGRVFRYLERGPRSRRRRNTSISFAA